MDIADALSQLADIHAPQAVGWWPLAPGWWLLIALLIAGLLWGLWKLMARLRLQRRANQAVAELDKCLNKLRADDEQDMQQRLIYVNEVNSVLRRVALAHFSQSEVAGLTGQQWIAFLRRYDQQQLLRDDLAQALAQGRFAPSCDIDTQALHSMAGTWIKGLYMARIDNNKTNSPSTATEHHA